MPKVSVIMPTYNAEKYLREAVVSILHQTFHDFELIVIDDNSTDGTMNILRSYHDERLRVLTGPCRGMAAALNMGMDVAKGEYIARMDADDISLPDRFEHQTRLLDTHPETGVCGTNAIAFHNGFENGYFGYNYFGDPVLERPGVFDQIEGVAVCHPTVMFRKSLFEKYNLRYNESYRTAEDQELWSRVLWHAEFYNIQKPLLKYRVHKGNATRVRQDDGAQRLSEIRKALIKRLMPSFDVLDDGLEIRAHQAIMVFRKRENYTEVIKQIFQWQPKWKKAVIYFLLDKSLFFGRLKRRGRL